MLWLNSAETWVGIKEEEKANFLSESGQLDVIMFSGWTPKDLLKTLA